MTHRSNPINVLVVVEEGWVDRIHEVAKALEKAGLRSSRVVDDLGGTISGTATADQFGALRKVPGVEQIVRNEEKFMAPAGPRARE
jgi:hypothetical protein